MTSAERVLEVLDERLDHPVELTIFGRAALALGFPEAPAEIERTLDVDGIIPLSQVDELEADAQFWFALDKTNDDLESEGLYFTHLFQEDQLALAPGWLHRRKSLDRPVCTRLKLYRPSAADLIVTKMMRGGDDEDMEDIRFLLKQSELRTEDVVEAMAKALLPNVDEIRALFEGARQKVLKELRLPR